MFTNQNKSKNHSFFMRLALAQAYKNLGKTKENPSVGCVITKNNSIISMGCTSINGRPHAEHNAITSCRTNLKGSEIYVTLEPCSHYGKTPPCTKSIIGRGLKKVFFSLNDPDLRSHNKSTKLFKKENITVHKGLYSVKTNNFYRSYFKFKKNILPFVTCKLAISKDFFTINKKNRWITNYFSRSRGHLIRSYHDCIITSSRTILLDNSSLTCRIAGLKKRSPARIILDAGLKIPLKSNIIKEANKYRTIVFYNKSNKKKINSLKKFKVNAHKISSDKNKNLNLFEVLTKAKKLGYYRILLESGMRLTSNFVSKNLVDDFMLFVSNKKLGINGRGKMKEDLKLLLKKRKFHHEKINLFGDKLLIYRLK